MRMRVSARCALTEFARASVAYRKTRKRLLRRLLPVRRWSTASRCLEAVMMTTPLSSSSSNSGGRRAG